MEDPELPRSDEYHEQILQVFREYFDANLRWTKYGYKQSGVDARSALRKISKLTHSRQLLLLRWRREFDTELRMYNDLVEERELQKNSDQNQSE